MNTEQTDNTNGSTNPDDGRIPVDTESASADWVKRASRERTLPLAALEVDGRPQMVFVPNEVLVDDADPDLVKLLVD